MKPRMTVTPLEELRRKRGARSQPWRPPVNALRRVAFIETAPPQAAAPGKIVLPWILAAVFLCAAGGATATWWLTAQNLADGEDRQIAAESFPAGNGGDQHPARVF